MRKDSKRAWETFQRLIIEPGGEVLEKEWLGAQVRHKVRCPAGHETTARPCDINAGRGMCWTCGHITRGIAQGVQPWIEFQRSITESGGEVLEKEWLGAKIPHQVQCSAGHITTVRPNSIRKGCEMCLICAHIKQGITQGVQPWIEFQRSITESGGEVLENQWLGSSTPHKIRCPAGHITAVQPHDIRAGYGMCRECAWQNQDVFYVVTDGSNVKLGITSNGATQRLSDHARVGFVTILFLCILLPKGLARYTESTILRELAERGFEPYSGDEWFREDAKDIILALTGVYMSDSFTRRWQKKSV